MSRDKIFLSFCSHNPRTDFQRPRGLERQYQRFLASFPRKNTWTEVLEAYLRHIDSYDGDDQAHSRRGLQVLVEQIYHPDVHHRIDFTRVGSLEMAKKHSWENLRENPQPPSSITSPHDFL